MLLMCDLMHRVTREHREGLAKKCQDDPRQGENASARHPQQVREEGQGCQGPSLGGHCQRSARHGEARHVFSVREIVVKFICLVFTCMPGDKYCR